MKTVEKNSLAEIMKTVLSSGKTLIAPVQDGRWSAFAAISDPSRAALDLRNAALPLKAMFFPATEKLLEFAPSGGGVELRETAPAAEQRVVFGARPCDAASLPIMDKVFTWDYRDNYYLARRENTAVVTIACEDKAPHCRCESVGLSPIAKDGSDVFLAPISNGRYSVEAVSEKGGKLISEWGAFLKGETEENSSEAAAARKSDGKPIEVRHEKLKERFESALWEELTMKCLGCGACAYVCPTCHCFDIVDEKCGPGEGCRRRNWDACAFEMFTMHGSMHNPRAHQWQRYRQRLMHKFDYYPEKFGVTACVGCGRCLAACPVAMDIFEILERVSADV
jgi:ferredoxin